MDIAPIYLPCTRGNLWPHNQRDEAWDEWEKLPHKQRAQQQEPLRRGHENGRDQMLQPRTVQIDFPKFSGGDPLDWIYRVEQFFTYQGTPNHQKVLLASFHLENVVVRW